VRRVAEALLLFADAVAPVAEDLVSGGAA